MNCSFCANTVLVLRPNTVIVTAATASDVLKSLIFHSLWRQLPVF
jgi:hypothetical protein